jgi:RNA polymerase sigma-70 factor, ECF subfamily
MYAAAMNDAVKGHGQQGALAPDLPELLNRIALYRDKSALAELFGLFAPRIKSMMLKLGADNALAEDLTQETLLSVWRKAALYSPAKGAASTWIFTIARNLRIDALRRQSNKPYVDLDTIELPAEAPLGHSVAEQKQVVARVSKALERLPPEQREVVQLSFVMDLAHSEIAERIGIPLGTVKSRLRLAYDRLRPLLEDLH